MDVPKVIAKVNKEELSALAENLGLDTIVSPKKIISVVRPQEAAPIEQPREEPIVISSEVTTPEETANTSDTKKGFVHALKQWLHLN